MIKATDIFVMFLFFLITCQNAFGQEKSIDTVYVTSDKFTVDYQMREQARKDIAEGNIFIHRGGLFGGYKNEDSLANKYGFKIMPNTCNPAEGYNYYNDEVVKYLNKRNGEGWWEKFLDEESKLEKIEIPALPTKND
ncbi:MAG: hypothetical protein WAR59_08855 [Ignavibacteriaceae bacterium]